MLYERTNDTSFKSHFNSIAACGVRVLKKQKNPFYKVVLFLGLIIAPFFWVYVALQRSHAGEKVLVPASNEKQANFIKTY